MSLVPKLDKNAAATEFKKIPAAQAGKEAGSSFNSSFGSAVKKLAGLAVFAQIGSAAASTFSEAFNLAAENEQLVGGIETLFAGAEDTMLQYAQNAYKTCGMSANQYMQQSTSFAASLVSSLGGDTAAAAEYANQAMTDMSDNANKMGTSMESIQNAYQGFAKQNFTMLDNLKLGYGGTKEEMQRLLDDAMAIKAANGEMADYSIDSFADITEAIHVVQENMGITGTTAEEASSTVQGSLGMLSSAWQNLLTDLGTGGEDMQVSIQAVVDSFGTAAGNVLELAGNIFQNLGTVISENLPIIVQNIVSYIRENGPTMLQTAIDFFLQIVTGIAQSLPTILAAIPDIIFGIVDAIWNNRGELVTAAGYLIEGLCEGLGAGIDAVIGKIQEICSGAIDAVKKFFGIASPSKVMMKMGGYIGEGMALGIESTASEITGAWDKAISGIGDVTATVGINATKRNSNLGTNYSFGSITINVKSIEEMDSIDKFTTMLRRASMQYA